MTRAPPEQLALELAPDEDEDEPAPQDWHDWFLALPPFTTSKEEKAA